MEQQELKLTFDDFALFEPEELKGRIWKDLGRQHRIPEAYRVTTSLWASALTHANLRVSNRLMACAPAELRARIGSLVVYHPVTPAESLRAQEQILDLYRYDLANTRYPGRVQERRSGYGSKGPETELRKHFEIGGRVLLDTRGVPSAAGFASEASVAYGLEPDYAHLQRVFRTVMDFPDDGLRAVVGSCDDLDLPTGRLDFLRAKPSDFGRDTGQRITREFERVVHAGGTIVVEGTAQEIDRFLEGQREYTRHSDVCVSRKM
jgi:hypothetical protein